MSVNSLGNRRILVIDDDDIFALMIDGFMSGKNVVLDRVGDLFQARQLLSHTSFDLILLDNYLPDGLGIELLSFLRQKEIDIPVLMITSDDDQASMKKCYLDGVHDYLLKPINLDLLWLKMQRCFNAYIAEHQLQSQNQQLETMLDEKKQQEQLARYVYRHLAESSTNVHTAIRSHLQASEAFNGDFFIAGQSPNGNYVMMLVDATGHGLAAAISVLPVVGVLRAMVSKGFSLGHIIYEINAKIYAEIPDDRFVACIGIEVDFQRSEVFFFNGGMPDILIIDDQCNIKERIKANCLPLGILDAQDFSPTIHSRPLVEGEHVLFFSDGLTEQTSVTLEAFSKTEFFAALASCQKAELAMETIIEAFTQHISNNRLADDVSLCYVNLSELLTTATPQERRQGLDNNAGALEMEMSLSGGLLGRANTVGLLDEILKNLNISATLRQKSFTIFSELVNNGLDHGILELSSQLKNDFEGFAEYLELREQRLAHLGPKDKLILKLHYQQADSKLHFNIEDSGKGYEANKDKLLDDQNLSGRGTQLVEKLCKYVQVHKPGNITSVIIK